jgi:hypothetical protein
MAVMVAHIQRIIVQKMRRSTKLRPNDGQVVTIVVGIDVLLCAKMKAEEAQLQGREKKRFGAKCGSRGHYLPDVPSRTNVNLNP